MSAHQFPEDVVAAVLRHMNQDHVDDSAIIVRAFADPDARSATMTGFDGEGADWHVEGADGATASARIAWPGGPIDERPAVRRQVVELYDAACEKLGVTPPVPMSTAIRERSRAAHSSSESAGFMASLLRGERTRDDYITLVAQHYFIYSALESAAETMRDDPIAAPFISDELTRLPALAADLAFLIGDDWRSRIAPLPATARYVARIEEVGSTWAGGFVAHHYTRYLGDLSGGLHIGKVVGRQFGFETAGAGFYVFDDIADPMAFKNGYRAQLDAAHWDEAERERVINEVLLAYRFNTEVFEELAAEPSAA